MVAFRSARVCKQQRGSFIEAASQPKHASVLWSCCAVLDSIDSELWGLASSIRHSAEAGVHVGSLEPLVT